LRSPADVGEVITGVAFWQQLKRLHSLTEDVKVKGLVA
jgi:hypothetical protein